MSVTRLGAARQISRQLAALSSRRLFSTSPRRWDSSPSSTSVPAPKTTSAPSLPQTTGESPPLEVQQAPNRAEVWSRSQKPRSEAMTGPRFEQTDFSLQPQPYSAMELIHRQPVTWTHERVVSCDGGGGPTGHPRIFINTDKPEIAVCGYCGLPYAHEHNRKHLEALPQTSYPL